MDIGLGIAGDTSVVGGREEFYSIIVYSLDNREFWDETNPVWLSLGPTSNISHPLNKARKHIN